MSNKKIMKELQTIGDYKKELARSKREIKALYKTIDQLTKELENTTPIPIDNSPVYELTTEEMIYDMQIKRIKEAAMRRDLTLEEAKKLELLGKIKKLAKDDRAIEIKAKPVVEDISEAQLIQIAGKSNGSKNRS